MFRRHWLTIKLTRLLYLALRSVSLFGFLTAALGILCYNELPYKKYKAQNIRIARSTEYFVVSGQSNISSVRTRFIPI